MWPGIIQNIPLIAMTDRTVTDRTEFRKILETVRDQGWSMVDQEMENGLLSIAVPLRNSFGGLVGAINVGAPTLRMDAKTMVETILPKLQQTAATISQALKH